MLKKLRGAINDSPIFRPSSGKAGVNINQNLINHDSEGQNIFVSDSDITTLKDEICFSGSNVSVYNILKLI